MGEHLSDYSDLVMVNPLGTLQGPVQRKKQFNSRYNNDLTKEGLGHSQLYMEGWRAIMSIVHLYYY